ncbi:MAG: M23 family metallopeptidase [Bacteroidota bacterium]
MNLLRIALFSLSLTSLLLGCGPRLPEKILSQYQVSADYRWSGDSLKITLSNSLGAPLRFFAKSSSDSLKKTLKPYFPVLVPPFQDTMFQLLVEADIPDKEAAKIYFSSSLGDVNREIKKQALSLPFPAGRQYKIIQGYNGSYSHNSTFSRYAIDFSTAVGDTICAADSGYVVGVIKGYEHGGNNRKWRNYANYITLYHPHSGVMTQYVHLDHLGSFVKLGDRVSMGQAIGISGMTGWTSIEHLHFNVIVPQEKGAASTTCTFVEGYEGKNLRKGQWVKKVK